MTEKNPFDMTEKAFQEYLDNFTIFESDSKIAEGKNVLSIGSRAKKKGISAPKWAETTIAKKLYAKYLKSLKNKKAHGGYVKKYAKGGGVRKVRT